MYSFERFVARANVKIQSFFEENKITSDEELRQYCIKENLSLPEREYFPTPAEEPEVKKEPKQEEVSETKKPAPKKQSKPRTTRRRTRKKTES